MMIPQDIQDAAEALVLLDETYNEGHLSALTDEEIYGIKLAYYVLGREMPLGDLI